ncbi:MAG: hypothetical protein HY721_25690 [Planctomycetes bacterium]|nr:hypothetical protein [Planctomycetota bacterium]
MLPSLTGTGPASLVKAEVALEGFRHETTSYWRLVYSASRHNQAPRYWVLFPEPVTVPGIEGPVRGVEVQAPEPALGVRGAMRYLDQDLEPCCRSEPVAYRREELKPAGDRAFLRGDADGSGRRDVADAVLLLAYLFQEGPVPGCAKAADADDDGRLGDGDAIALLLHAFAGRGPLPEPFASCGADPTVDRLECLGFEDSP